MEVELNSSSPMSGGLSPADCARDPEEKEISDDDDDDRNHKHRRREARSQSLETDSLEQSLTQPYRKRNRTFENGQSDPQSHYSLDRDFSKFDKRRYTGLNFSRFEHGPGRGRGRDYQRDSRFVSMDVASQMAHPGSITSAMFSVRGLSNVSNGPSASWNGFGLIPPIPNGAIDAMNPLGLPGMLRPQLNPSLNMGIQRQRCRDFEERGFCLRGDMCPMEHGVNRIVVEDVQSLSQFNLPVSAASAHLLGTSPGGGFVPSISVPPNTLINNRVLHGRTGKSAVDDDALNLDGTFSGTINATGADVYDPDQPLWNNDAHDTSTPLLGLQPSNIDESESLVDTDLSDRIVRSSGAAVGSQSTSSSVWGRLNSSKNKMELKEKFDPKIKPSGYSESRSKEILEAPGGTQGASHPTKQNYLVPKTMGSISKVQSDMGSNVRKPTQKAQRTLFVNCIPLKDNKKENLLSHFRKFGEVIDIYIPANSERAFVQFSNREEAERALKAPDAVMGSRFIKLWWANRDSVVDDGASSGNNVSLPPRNVSTAANSPHPAVNSKGKDNTQCAVSKGVVPKAVDSLVTVGNDFNPVSANGPKALPGQKKMENLELLKEELRKKQEMLEQKRNEFRRQLDKLAKQATGVKSDIQDAQATKRQKLEMSTENLKPGKSVDAVVSGSSGQADMLMDKVLHVESTVSPRSKSNSAATLQDPLSSKHAFHPMATSGALYHVNRYKLDNRPKSFRIHGPLPDALADVTALRGHFSSYGEISNVEVEELGEEDCPKASNDSGVMRNFSARISFVTRGSAERAFLNGKSWHGHDLKFMWVTSNIPSTSRSSGESSSATKGVALNAEVQSIEKTTHEDSQDTSGPTKSSSSPCKPLNEPSCDSSRSDGRGSSPVDVEECSVFEAQSPDKSANFIPLEADEAENRDSEEQEEIDGDGMQLDEDSKGSPQH